MNRLPLLLAIVLLLLPVLYVGSYLVLVVPPHGKLLVVSQKQWDAGGIRYRCGGHVADFVCVQIGTDEDDYAFLADDELGDAPVNPGTYEGGHAKPTEDSERLNKWCVRECERSDMADLGELCQPKDFSKRRYNMREND